MLKEIKLQMLKPLVLTCALGLIAPFSHATVIEIFDGVGAGDLRADWEAAAGAFTEEDFSDGVSDDFTTSFVGGGHTGAGISGGLFSDRLVTGSSTVFTFDTPILSFGANFDLTPGGAGLGLQIVAGTETLSVEIPSTFTGQFFGFTANAAITSVTFLAGTDAGLAETYNADNFVYTSVPAPGTLALMGLGLAAFGVSRKRYHV